MKSFNDIISITVTLTLTSTILILPKNDLELRIIIITILYNRYLLLIYTRVGLDTLWRISGRLSDNRPDFAKEIINFVTKFC